MLNREQQFVLAFAILLFAVSELFPPWQYEDEGTSGVRKAGYHYLYSPPKVKSPSEMQVIYSYPNQETPCCVWVHKDNLRLNAQRVTLFLLALGLLLSLGKPRLIVNAVLGGIFVFIGVLSLGAFIWLCFEPY
jgi:hypothetical protein